ncbi:response regulator [Roseateles microcysteis]|uniref:response regulator n=1 Tax=Roseateles microcysteis TaxID=3119057 RepID=UPI002FE5FFB4
MTAHIAIIEDNQANLELVKFLLECSGYLVSVARDGVQGVELVFRVRPDLVICDLQMPAMDGYQVLSQLRATPDVAPIPVIAVTAFSMPNDRHKVLTAGFDGYISKPIDPATFVGQVGAFLPAGLRRSLPASPG